MVNISMCIIVLLCYSVHVSMLMLLLWSLSRPLSAYIVIKIPIASETTTASSKLLTFRVKNDELP